VEVFVYLMVFSAEQLKSNASIELKKKDKSKRPPHLPFTSDQYLYEISEIKSNLTKQLTDVVKESSFDCYIYNGKNCVNFGNPSKGDFSYVPDYSSQQNDTTVRMTKKSVEIRGMYITVGTKRYVGEQIGNNVFKLYDEKSYLNALNNPGEFVREIGTLEYDKDGKDIIKYL